MAKTNKTTANTAATVRADLENFATVKRERVAFLDSLPELSDAEKDERLACVNRAARAERFAAAMDSAPYAEAVTAHGLNAAAMLALQIYAQDKLHETLRAIAADCALSAVAARGHSNMMTQRLVQALDKHGKLTIGEAPKAMYKLNPDKSVGTYSAQASSSRQVLDLLGLLAWDTMTKQFALNERAEALRHVIAK